MINTYIFLFSDKKNITAQFSNAIIRYKDNDNLRKKMNEISSEVLDYA